MDRTNIINSEHFFAAFNDFNCGKTPFIEVDAKDFEKPFFEVKPTEGYQTPANKETGEELPNCCEGHKRLFKETQDWFDKFPMCCEAHKKLSTARWFKKENYANVAFKVVQQLAYMEHHISKQIDTPDWYKEITDYIEYNYQSFGQLPTGYGSAVGLHIYLHQIKCWFEDKNVPIPDEKKKKLSEYVELYYNPPKELAAGRDLNILYATYQRWLKLFPFEISYFAKVKERFSKQLPFLSEPPVLNKYLGLAKAKLQTQDGLSKTLNNFTIQLLKEINTGELLEKGLITDKNKHTLELANANHRLKQNSLLVKYTKGEMKYVKLLKTWLANEKKHFNEIVPLINKVSETPPSMAEKEMEKIRLKMEKQEDEAEIQRGRDFEFYIDKNYNYSPTFEDFIEELAIQKKATDLSRMLLFLREAKKMYVNARHYYTVWGARGTHIDRGPLYDKIIILINVLINRLLNISIEEFQAISLTDLFEVTKPIFNYTNLEEYFYPGKLSVFKNIENEMVQMGILNSNGHWSSEYTKNDLVAFILILKRVGILKSKMNNISDSRSMLRIKHLFESRYNVNSLDQELKPSRVKKNRIDYKHVFPFIPGI